MSTPEIKEFAKNLMEIVRDEAIQACDRQLGPDSRSRMAKRWRDARSHHPEDFPSMMIADCVDETLAILLRAIDEGALRLSFTAANGKVVDLTEEGLGELCGWYLSAGWRPTYAKERFVDDYAEPDSP